MSLDISRAGAAASNTPALGRIWLINAAATIAAVAAAVLCCSIGVLLYLA